MSSLLLLPGNSPRHREWIYDVQAQIGGTPVLYSHWDTGKDTIDLDDECQKLQDIVNNETCVVFAKSAGVLLAMKAVREGRITLKRAVFLGTPLSWAIDQGFALDEWLDAWEIPTLCIQNEFDPYASAEELAERLPENCELLVLDGDTHDYRVFDDYIPQVKTFLE